MECNRRTSAGPAMDLRRVTDFVFRRDSRCRLQIFPETGTGIGKSPGRNLDTKSVKGVEYSLLINRVHRLPPSHGYTESRARSHYIPTGTRLFCSVEQCTVPEAVTVYGESATSLTNCDR